MAYFLGSDVKVALTVEHATKGLKVDESGSTGFYNLTANASSLWPVSSSGVKEMSASNLGTGSALVDVTGLDLGIGAMDEDVSYLGHRTPLKAEVHKETTVSITIKRKNALFDVIYSGDKNATIGRWGVNSDAAVADGLSEPTVTYGFRLAIYIKSGTEVFTVKNAAFVGHSISLNADGTQEETLEFSSQVEPTIDDTVNSTATTEAQL